MFKFKKTPLVATLIAAYMVATSVAASASAQTLTITQLHAKDTATQQRVLTELITQFFPEPGVAVRMLAIAECEGGLAHTRTNANGEVGLVEDPRGTFFGLFQVHRRVHRAEITRLLTIEGRDIRNDVHEYFRFIRYLYDFGRRQNRNGFAPWPNCQNRPVTPAHHAAVERARNYILLADVSR